MSAISPEKTSGNSNTSKTFLTALVANAALLAVEVGAFLILKQKLWRVYSPRSYLPPPDKRAQQLPSGPWKWLPAMLFSPSQDIIHKNGLDAYMFLRFLKMLVWIFSVFTLLTFVVIIPAIAANVQSPYTGLERISWSNIIEPRDQPRFSAHIIVVYLLTCFVIFMIRREMVHFIHMRHQFLISKSHSRLAQARTVLITSVPDELANEHDLRTFASFVPGGVDRVWILRDHAALNSLFEARQDACLKLEAAEATILHQANKAWRKRGLAFCKQQIRTPKDEEKDLDGRLPIPLPSSELLNDLVPPTRRPTHRTGFLGFVGTKVDTINWCKDEIAHLNVKIKEERANIVEGKFLGSAFIRCNLQMGAHVLAQCVSYHEPLRMYDKWMEANPKDIVWKNLDDGALEMRSRYVTSWLATIGLIISWAFPVAFIGTLSNLDDLCVKVHWLKWVCNAPSPIPGIIQGILPPVLLAILFSLLPFILRGLAWYECIPRYSLISVSVYRRFYLFLLIHGFLIVTLSSGITKAIEGIIARPTETVQELASQLPGASVFFLTYIVTQGLAGAGGALAQLVPLILHFIRKSFLGRTPRQAYAVTFQMPSADFGVVLPRLSLLATIGFAYSILSPLINFLALISFTMFYIAWKFLLTQVFDQPDEAETGGLYFPMAVSNLFVGLYIEQICLACLFFLKVQSSGVASLVEGILMLVLLVITFSAQIFINHSFDPITQYLPMSLATKKMAKRYEKEKQKDGGVIVGEELDLFSRNQIRSIRKRIKKTTKRLDDKLDDLKARVKGDDARDSDSHTENIHDEKQNSNVKVSTGTPPAPLEGIPELFRSRSGGSQTSKKSKGSKTSTKAVDVPVFDPAAPAGVDLSDDSDEEDDSDIHAFDHPSTYVEQSWIWLPRDPLGLSQVLANDLKAVGVDASDVGAAMDEKGIVEVTRNPPDEEWSGGHDN
ncbi:Uncharacterized protein RSN1 [Hypsizygus marmoreus]|uniref:Uncharacterized protein RSN1 n=1 Tax=Hypsizygus marmoreus TaxID=39966 RepID=A0A369JRF0_HYPMA|nr:Uncharacterized protein RSN1 [Hypsizygus marmoreus]